MISQYRALRVLLRQCRRCNARFHLWNSMLLSIRLSLSLPLPSLLLLPSPLSLLVPSPRSSSPFPSSIPPLSLLTVQCTWRSSIVSSRPSAREIRGTDRLPSSVRDSNGNVYGPRRFAKTLESWMPPLYLLCTVFSSASNKHHNLRHII